MSDFCYSRPMLDRVSRQAELMDRMMERVGVNAAAAARVDKGMAWYEARTKCIACCSERQWRDWLARSEVQALRRRPSCADAAAPKYPDRTDHHVPPHTNPDRRLEQLKVDRTDPMSFFISIMRNPDAPFEEVKAAARELFPYSHPKLASVEARGGGKTHEERLEELQRMASEETDDGT